MSLGVDPRPSFQRRVYDVFNIVYALYSEYRALTLERGALYEGALVRYLNSDDGKAFFTVHNALLQNCATNDDLDMLVRVWREIALILQEDGLEEIH